MVWADWLEEELLEVEPLDVEPPELVAEVAPVAPVVPDDAEVPDVLEPAAWVTVAVVEPWNAMKPVSPSALLTLMTAAIFRARAARGLRGAGFLRGMVDSAPPSRPRRTASLRLGVGTRGCSRRSFMPVTVRTRVEGSARAR